jgi:phenylacetate-coenzyme A ligase PaaK-like adenylate-forming protein
MEDEMAGAMLMTGVANDLDGAWLEPQPSHDEMRRCEHLQEMKSRVPAHLERIGWPAEGLRAERRERLRRLVQIAQERSPWHRERLGHLNPNELGEEDLANIPPMTKHDLMTNYDRIVTDPRLTLDLIESHLDGLKTDAYLLDRYHAVASGGSSGHRGVFVYDWESWADCFLSCLRYAIRLRLQHPDLMRRPMQIATVAAERATHMSSALPRTFSDPASTRAIPVPITQPLPRIVAGLNEVDPDVVVAYPSILPDLAHEARAGRLRISPRFICAASEPLLPEIRAVTEETWGVPVMNWWASSEAGGMAISCGLGPGLHLSDDLMIVEPVDANGQPVPPGTRSDKIYLTNLYNPLLPLIRFEITDQIILLDETEPCPCGTAHRRIADVEGRLDDAFAYPGIGSVHPHVFRSRLGSDRNIVEYQVRQTERGAAIAIRCRGRVNAARLQHDLAGDLIRLGLREPEITILQVERLERQATGKLKRFVPLATQTTVTTEGGSSAA